MLAVANMSVHDVAAVDHLNSLQRPRKFDEKKHFLNFDTKQSNSRRSPYNASLPTSPTSERKTDSDTLRRAMARHQVGLTTNALYDHAYLRPVCPALNHQLVMTTFQHQVAGIPHTAGNHHLGALHLREGPAGVPR